VCYDADAAPPSLAAALTTVAAAPLMLTSRDGTRFGAFLATPERRTGIGVVVLPDNRGLRGFYEQLAVQLAEQGHTALAIDYFARSAEARYRDREEFGGADEIMSHLAKLTKNGLYGDIGTAVDHLRSPEGGGCTGVLSLGFCLGGRFAFLTAADRFGLAGVIGFYGATDALNGTPGPTQLAGELTAPILGLFGGADEAGVEHEIVIYPGAPHGFFDDCQEDHAAAAGDAWTRVLAFIDRRGGAV
jgi:carboxymethylenebutenolidase